MLPGVDGDGVGVGAGLDRRGRGLGEDGVADGAGEVVFRAGEGAGESGGGFGGGFGACCPVCWLPGPVLLVWVVPEGRIQK